MHDIRTTEGYADVLLNTCKDTGLAVNIETSNYIEVSIFLNIMFLQRWEDFS